MSALLTPSPKEDTTSEPFMALGTIFYGLARGLPALPVAPGRDHQVEDVYITVSIDVAVDAVLGVRRLGAGEELQRLHTDEAAGGLRGRPPERTVDPTDATDRAAVEPITSNCGMA